MLACLSFLLYLCNMNQLPTLIEYLLLNHDYVVIPDLGTFIVQLQDARRNEAEEAFLPPIRSVRFNTELIHSDDLLVNSIAAIYNITLQEAHKLLDTWTDDFKQNIEDNGCLEFGAIGVFSKEDDGTLLFAPQEAGVTTPEFYGLDAFHMSVIETEQKARVVPLAATMEADDSAITIRINRRVANFVAAACAIIMFFVFANSPIPDLNHTEQLSSIKELLMPTAGNSGAKQQAAEPTHIEKALPAPSKEAAVPSLAESAPAIQSQQDEYCIVMASAISMKNAENFVKQLKEDGFVSARVMVTGKMVRVVVGHYANEAEANEASSEIRNRSKAYHDAWVFHLS